MRKLLAAALAAILFPLSAHAADEVVLTPKDAGYEAFASKSSALSVSNGGTNDTFDFGFWSNQVRVCLNAGLGTGPLYIRRGTTLSDSPGAARASQDPAGMTVVATTDAIFQNGNTTDSPGIASGRAGIIRAFVSSGMTPGSTYYSCNTYPLRTRGVILHASSGVSVDVTAFGNPKN